MAARRRAQGRSRDDAPGSRPGTPFLRRTTSLDIIQGVMLGVFRFGTADVNLPTPVDVRDLVEAFVLAAEKPSEGRFIVANDDTVSFLELTRVMHRIDRSVPAAQFILPNFVFRFTDFIDWFNARTLGAPLIFTTQLTVASLGKLSVASNARARRELGWTPTILFEQSLAETMPALQELRATEKARGDAGQVHGPPGGGLSSRYIGIVHKGVERDVFGGFREGLGMARASSAVRVSL
ncbi:hypothetical protein ACN2CC_32590 [Mesorhizobium muleiense]|uniref:hypothetical protein n=1 Tax=Mesorhizobium muleiense TaxID=1004279 RepID=UPI003AFB00DB